MRRRAVLLIFGCLFLTSCGNGDRGQSGAVRDEALAPKAAIPESDANFTIVMLGDSITAGYGLPADKALPVKLQETLRADSIAVNVINAGVSGDTTGDALARLEWALSGGGDAIVIALGGNDLLQGIGPETTEANLRAIIEAARARGLKVALAGMRAPGNYGEAYRTRFDSIYERLAKQYGVPLYPFLLAGVASDPALNQPDGIHPNEAGVHIIVSELAPFIERSGLLK